MHALNARRRTLSSSSMVGDQQHMVVAGHTENAAGRDIRYSRRRRRRRRRRREKGRGGAGHMETSTGVITSRKFSVFIPTNVG